MKKVFVVIVMLLVAVASYAKKVKFSVDMSAQVVNVTGVHVVGDFQTLAGFLGGDWNSATTVLDSEMANSNIYSLVVDIPAFAKYEYKFVNGDQFYEAEFVPQESRVGYNFNDNRWLYLDSLSDDTTDVGAIVFAANAPAGKILVRYLVDMQQQSMVNANGVHIAGDFQGWDATKTIMYSFGNSIYEIINYLDIGAVEYKFYNGNSTSFAENIVGSCANVTGNRSLTISSDVVLDAVCYGECAACTAAGLNEMNSHEGFSMFPNPSSSASTITFANMNEEKLICIYDLNGKLVLNYRSKEERKVVLPLKGMNKGIYFVAVRFNNNERIQQTKLIIE